MTTGNYAERRELGPVDNTATPRPPGRKEEERGGGRRMKNVQESFGKHSKYEKGHERNIKRENKNRI